MSGEPEFLVARNPDRQSSLPYLVYVPLADGGFWLKAREAWPRETRVYCHPVAEAPDLSDVEIVSRVPVVQCERRGNAIDLILARGINKRSQFVFVRAQNRRIILWQTARAAMSAKPGLRIPLVRNKCKAVIYVDTRERYGYSFRRNGAIIERRALHIGDYAAIRGDSVIGVVERKTLQDFANSLVSASLSLAMAELTTIPFAAVVVEGSLSDLLRHRYVRGSALMEMIARLQVRYPAVSINFLDSRKVAESWAYRYLCAVYAITESS